MSELAKATYLSPQHHGNLDKKSKKILGTNSVGHLLTHRAGTSFVASPQGMLLLLLFVPLKEVSSIHL